MIRVKMAISLRTMSTAPNDVTHLGIDQNADRGTLISCKSQVQHATPSLLSGVPACPLASGQLKHSKLPDKYPCMLKERGRGYAQPLRGHTPKHFFS